MNGVIKDTVVVVEIGQPVTANEHAEEFNLTEGTNIQCSATMGIFL